MASKKSKTTLKAYLEEKDQQWESLCIRCGGCCGAYDDPCTHLKKDKDDKYYCDIYENRFGPQVTVSGERFNCVWVREILHTHWKNDHLCVYKKIKKRGWVKK